MRLLAASLTAPWRLGLYESPLSTNYLVHHQYITRWWWLSENCYIRPQSNIPAYRLSTVGETGAYSFPSEFIHYDLVPSRAPLSIVPAKKNSLLCLLQRPNFFKTYGENYTRLKLYHLSSKHKIICNRNYFSSEALLVLYLPVVCFWLGYLLTGFWSWLRQRNGVMQLVYSYFEKGCRKNCARDNPERQYGIWSMHFS